MSGWMEEYQRVEDRLREFHERFPSGRVVTHLIDNGAVMPGDAILFRAELFRGDELRDMPCAATGYAHQRILKEPPPKKDGTPNYSAPEWTSPWETAETSAVGRALANLGFAPKGARPSFEEVRKADVAASVSPPKPRTPAPSDDAAKKAPEDVQAIATVQMLTAALGSPKQAANWVNRHCHTSYDAATVIEATTEELEIAVAALSERAST